MPQSRVKTVCPYCGVGCGMILSVQDGQVVKVAGDPEHPANAGKLCTKGSSAHAVLRDPGRLSSAYARRARGQDPVALPMKDAVGETARRLREVIDTHGPDAMSFYVSGQMSIEAQYLANKLAKGYIGTNHIESNSRLCMASAGSGYKLSLGSDAPPGSYDDFDRTDLFFVIGSNMGDCHPILYLRMMSRIKAGARLIVVDPRRTITADKAHLFLQIRPGTDLALLNGLLHLLHERGSTDAAFIAQFTEGWDDMLAFLADYTPEKVSRITGLAEADIRTAAQWIAEAPEWLSCWTMGLNQSTRGTWHTNALCNLHLATGKICRPGSGPFSLTGQPNAMGGREMGYMGAGLPGQRSVLSAADRRYAETVWGLPQGTLHDRVGQGTVDLFSRMRAGDIKACWIICTNPVASVPNRANVVAGLQAADLVISQDAFLDTETNRYADILLPGALWAEGEGVMINSERNLTLMQQAVDPPGAAQPDWRIIADVACAMGYAHAFTYRDAAEVFDEITRFSNLDTGYDLRGASHDALRAGSLQWPLAPGAGSRNPIRYINDGASQTRRTRADGVAPRLAFPTPSGKARFIIAGPPQDRVSPTLRLDTSEAVCAEYPFVFSTGRLQHQWHTLTKTGKVSTLNKLNPSPFIEIHPDDAGALGISPKDTIEITSARGRAVLPAVITERVLPGVCFSPMHWNDVYGDALCVNAVTQDAVDPVSLQPEIKFCTVALTRLEPSSKADTQVRIEQPGSSPAVDESTMSHINTFAAILALDDTPVPKLADAEQAYLSGFLNGLRNSGAGGLVGLVPMLPPNAPFSAEKRMWLDGLLAGLFSRGPAPMPARPPGLHDASSDPDRTLVPRARPRVQLLWASQTGNVESLTEDYATRLMQAGFEIHLACMQDCDVGQLAKAQYVLLMSSTFGDGDPPDNGNAFWTGLQAQADGFLTGVHFSVLALGDRNYEQFCGHGRQLDACFERLGATRLMDRIDCDVEFSADARKWLDQVIVRIKECDAALHAAAPRAPQSAAGLPASRQRPAMSRLVSNVRLNLAGSAKDTRCIALSQPAGIDYEAGDALGVWPSNCPELVNECLDILRLKPDTSVRLDDMGDLPLADALARHMDIARPNAQALAFVAARSKNETLMSLLDDARKPELRQWLRGRQLVDVLREFPVEISANEFVSLLPRLQPRLYSIASSPLAHPGEVHLTVSTVRYDHGGRQRKGVASTFLADRAGDDVPVFVQKSLHFHLPAQSDVPIIMVGPGTGIAPFRGFLHQRRAAGARGRNWLFFGEQHEKTDFYYRDELMDMRDDGLLSRLDLAFSRDQSDKIYVQDRMRERGAQLWSWLQEGAYFYVCGDAHQMAKDVDIMLKTVVADHGGMATDKAAEYVARLAREKRYVRDVY